MKAYGYIVLGDAEILNDIAEILKDESNKINWRNFQTGEFYYTTNGKRYIATIDHSVNQVALSATTTELYFEMEGF